MARWKKLPALILAAVLSLSLAGCEKQPEAVQTTVFAMDTVMNLTLYGEQETLDRAVEDLSRLEEQFSATLEDSLVFRLNQGETVSPSQVLQEVLEQSILLGQRTGGALDITAYPAVRAWGFTTGDYRVPGGDELAQLADRIDDTHIQFAWAENGRCDVTLADGAQIDLGAVAKGYAGDLLAEDLRHDGVTSALLDLGQSSIMAVGAKPDGSPWRIGVQDPEGDGYLGVLELNNMAMGTSGSYQRYFEQDGVRYCHIIDPKTAAPARSGLSSVTVVAKSCLVCDGLSTALFVMGLEESAEFWRGAQSDPDLAFEAIFIEDNGAISVTSGLKDAFSLAEGYTDREVTVLE